MAAIPQIRAAGGVVVRPAASDAGELEVLLVHRPRYDDWSLPKGKLKPGEDWRDGALREVEEETGLACELGRELESVSYLDRKGRRKLVRYWLMRPLAGTADGPFVPNDEVDAIRWLPFAEALRALTYEHDSELVALVQASS